MYIIIQIQNENLTSSTNLLIFKPFLKDHIYRHFLKAWLKEFALEGLDPLHEQHFKGPVLENIHQHDTRIIHGDG